ncbi:MAG: NADP-dependent malic enzyme [Candidatus Bathyarchaeia archaeon]
MSERSTREELLERSCKPSKLALKYHVFYRGKIEVSLKTPVRSYEEFAIWYTPGVAEPCKAISENRGLVYDLTNRWNTVAIVSDGTRVLGLGNIGPEAALPVMEGKALLFKYLGGVDAYPLCLATQNAEELISAVKWLQPSFGGINLEDIEQPKCFYILNRLRKETEIPVWHDDQQGTATVMLAALKNALKLVGKRIGEIQIAMIGAGAASICTARLFIAAGVKPGNMFVVDSKGILHSGRVELKGEHPEKWELCLRTNLENRMGGIEEAMRGVDVAVAMSRPGPGVIKPEWVRNMACEPIVFAAANPVPEIWPWEAKEAGARVVATGRSDFPNQVNNSLGFPGIFRGVLDVRAASITDEMCIAAADELARLAEEKGLSEDYIIPSMAEWEVYPREAVAVAQKAIEQGVARIKPNREDLYENASNIIKRAQSIVEHLARGGLIKEPPP